MDFGIRGGRQFEYIKALFSLLENAIFGPEPAGSLSSDLFNVFYAPEQGRSRARGPKRLKDARGRPGKPMEGKETQISARGAKGAKKHMQGQGRRTSAHPFGGFRV